MWQIEELELELRYSWKISRNTSDSKTNFLVKITEGKTSGTGEVAPNIRYDETPENIKKGFAAFLEFSEQLSSIDALTSTLDTLNLPHALRFGIESAYIHFQCKKTNKSIYSYLDIQPPLLPLKTSFSLPIMDMAEIKKFYKEYHLSRFNFLKVKVNREEGYEIIRELNRHTSQPLIIDGNECWQEVEECIYFMESLSPFPVMFIEQPMPAGNEEEYIHLKKHSRLELVADESCTYHPDFESLQKQFHGINMKLMKAGGYLNGLRILKEAKKLRMKTMIGCMVESSVGIASAMHLCHGIDYIDLDGFLILKNEPFGLVEENNGSLNFNQ
jgi:L-alanine-DL-glutamate epimerase-like enolase superfamily enzyme